MKQYTNESQTAKLIELGFEEPNNERWVLDIVNESTLFIPIKLAEINVKG